MPTDKPTTYHALSQIDAEQEQRGRFAAPRPYTVGQDETVSPPLPQSALAWPDGADVFGEAIDSVPDQTTLSGAAREALEQQPQACPYASSEGHCALVQNEIGPCLCGGQR
jgi:hypothetical protein